MVIVGAAESADFVKEESAAFAPKSQQIWLQKPAHGPALNFFFGHTPGGAGGKIQRFA